MFSSLHIIYPDPASQVRYWWPFHEAWFLSHKPLTKKKQKNIWITHFHLHWHSLYSFTHMPIHLQSFSCILYASVKDRWTIQMKKFWNFPNFLRISRQNLQRNTVTNCFYNLFMVTTHSTRAVTKISRSCFSERLPQNRQRKAPVTTICHLSAGGTGV